MQKNFIPKIASWVRIASSLFFFWLPSGSEAQAVLGCESLFGARGDVGRPNGQVQFGLLITDRNIIRSLGSAFPHSDGIVIFRFGESPNERIHVFPVGRTKVGAEQIVSTENRLVAQIHGRASIVIAESLLDNLDSDGEAMAEMPPYARQIRIQVGR